MSDIDTQSNSSVDEESPSQDNSLGFGNLRIPNDFGDDDFDELERGEEVELEILILPSKQILNHRMFSSAAVENLKQWIEDQLEIPIDSQKLYSKNPELNANEREVPNPLSLSDIQGISGSQVNKLFVLNIQK